MIIYFWYIKDDLFNKTPQLLVMLLGWSGKMYSSRSYSRLHTTWFLLNRRPLDLSDACQLRFVLVWLRSNTLSVNADHSVGVSWLRTVQANGQLGTRSALWSYPWTNNKVNSLILGARVLKIPSRNNSKRLKVLLNLKCICQYIKNR